MEFIIKIPFERLSQLIRHILVSLLHLTRNRPSLPRFDRIQPFLRLLTSKSPTTTDKIPGPNPIPLIGNLLDLQDDVPIRALERLTDIYGPIYKIKVGGNERVIVGGFDLFDELCDETKHWKIPPKALRIADPKVPQGLFSASSERLEDWGQAHRILMPAFGPLAIEDMFDEMFDIASQLILKWTRQGPSTTIPVTGDFTRLTLDTIALCTMDFRFNSFYQDDMHPFVKAMNNVLTTRSNASQLSTMLMSLLPSHNAQVAKDAQYQRKVAMNLVQYRKDNPTKKRDLLNAMIYNKDPKSGETLRDGLIAANMVTFLIAGHETTSGLLSFAFLNLLKNPATYFAAQEEIDRIVGNQKITAKHLIDLKYINAVLRETLRLTPTAPIIVRGPRPENKDPNPTICGTYGITRDEGATCLMTKIQRDPKVFPDPDEFKPERMMDEEFEKLPKNAWKPFGTGMRACIGRAFAWQEALLVVSLILQNFDLKLDDPNYQMQIQQSLTLKPKDFGMQASLRFGKSATLLQDLLYGPVVEKHDLEKINVSSTQTNGTEKAIQVLFGSNTGTCEALARKLAGHLSQRCWTPTVLDMDHAVNQVRKEIPVIVICSLYEGQPTDNSNAFIAWLESSDKSMLQDVKYAVFGCGHSDWRSTYQRIPTLVDNKFAELGAIRLTNRGSVDASKGDIFSEFEIWSEKSLLPVLGIGEAADEKPAMATVPAITLELSFDGRASHLQQHVQWASIVDVKSLTFGGSSEKRHIEIQLPSNMTYSVGDYMAILPTNPENQIHRVVKRFSLPWDGVITITDSGSTLLPSGSPILVSELLKGYVELSQCASRRDLRALAEHTQDPIEKRKLEGLAGEIYTTAVVDHKLSVLDLLETCPSIKLSFAQYLSLLPPLKLRHYSISSSPLANPNICTLTYSVLDAPALSGLASRFKGVTTTYLQSLHVGDQIQVSVRSTNKYFRPPADPSTPIIMFCAGSGIAPFRGFIQERAVMITEGKRELAPAILFVGCRSPSYDRLYAEELDEWVKIGAVDVRYAFSKDPEASEGCKYIQDRLVKDKKDVIKLWDAGSKIFICGSREVARDVGAAAREIVEERLKEKGIEKSCEEIERWFEEKRNERFVSDVFS